MRPARIATFLVGVALILGAAACGGTTADVKMYDNFKPNGIVGDVGETIMVRLTNAGKVKHNFSVPFLGIDRDVQPGKTVEVTLKIPPRSDTVSSASTTELVTARGWLAA